MDLDGNTAALDIWEREELRLDMLQASIEAAAEPIYKSIMLNLDSDVLDGAFAQLTPDEYRSLEEDLSDGPMSDSHHAGTILKDALRRYVLKEAIKEVQFDEG